MIILYYTKTEERLTRELIESKTKELVAVKRCKRLSLYVPISLRLAQINDKFNSSRNASLNDSILQDMYKPLY